MAVLAQGAGNTMKIVAEPWRLENYTTLVKGMSDFVEKSADRAAKQRSNDQQTFQFIGRLRRVIA